MILKVIWLCLTVLHEIARVLTFLMCDKSISCNHSEIACLPGSLSSSDHSHGIIEYELLENSQGKLLDYPKFRVSDVLSGLSLNDPLATELGSPILELNCLPLGW